MKKIIIVLIAVIFILGATGCKSSEEKMMEKAMKEFEDMTEQEQYSKDNLDNMNDEDNTDLESHDDGMDDENEQAGVGEVDNSGREGETYVEDNENAVQLGSGEWPEDAPLVIEEPKFIEAKISGILSSANGTVIAYLGVGRTEAAELIQAYNENKDWTMLSHTNDSDWEVFTGQNGDVILTIDWDNGEFSIMWEIFG